MGYTPNPFNYTGDLPNQVENDLNLANDNFNILAQAFVNNDPTTLKVKNASNADNANNADTVDGFHASQIPTADTIPVADSSGKIDPRWLNVYALVPYWRVSIDETSGSRTSPINFIVSRQLKYMTYGSIFLFVYSWGTWSTLWEMKVNCPSAMSVSGKIGDIDDNVYIYLNGVLVVSATSTGFKNVSFTLNFVAGENLIQIVHNNSVGGAVKLDIEIDFNWTQIRFVPL